MYIFACYSLNCPTLPFPHCVHKSIPYVYISTEIVVQSPSHVQLFATPWTAARKLPCPSPSPRVCPSSCPLHQWCHPTISTSVALFSFCLQSFPASGSFPMSWLFASGGQSIGASALVLPLSIKGWFPLRLTDMISLLSKGLSWVFSSTTVQNYQFFSALPSLWSSSQSYLTTGKTIVLTIQTFVSKVMTLLFNTLSKFVIAFLPRSNCLLISWLQSPSAVILEHKKRKSVTISTFPPSICMN